MLMLLRKQFEAPSARHSLSTNMVSPPHNFLSLALCRYKDNDSATEPGKANWWYLGQNLEANLAIPNPSSLATVPEMIS